MGFIILGLYIISISALILGIYIYIGMQDIIKANNFNSTNTRRVESRVSNLEKILNNKKWTWK